MQGFLHFFIFLQIHHSKSRAQEKMNGGKDKTSMKWIYQPPERRREIHENNQKKWVRSRI